MRPRRKSKLELALEIWGDAQARLPMISALGFPSYSIDIPTKAKMDSMPLAKGKSAQWASQKQTRIVRPRTPNYWPGEYEPLVREVHSGYLELRNGDLMTALWVRYVENKRGEDAAKGCECGVRAYQERLAQARSFMRGWLRLED